MKVTGIDAAAAALRQSLSRSTRRIQAVASNLANLDTPGYRALDVAFDDPFPGGIGATRTSPSHLGGARDPVVRAKLVEAPATHTRGDGNTVDVDREMMLAGKLQGRYRASAEMLRKRFALWLYAVTDGRR